MKFSTEFESQAVQLFSELIRKSSTLEFAFTAFGLFVLVLIITAVLFPQYCFEPISKPKTNPLNRNDNDNDNDRS